MTLPPGWVPAPQRKTPGIGVCAVDDIALSVLTTVIGRRIGGIAWRGRLYRTEELRDEQRVRV